MTHETMIHVLVQTFRFWGTKAAKNIRDLTREHGVLCGESGYSSFSDGESG